jgi:hypothetical protein
MGSESISLFHQEHSIQDGQGQVLQALEHTIGSSGTSRLGSQGQVLQWVLEHNIGSSVASQSGWPGASSSGGPRA